VSHDDVFTKVLVDKPTYAVTGLTKCERLVTGAATVDLHYPPV